MIEDLKPDFKDVYAYAQKSAQHFIRKIARHLSEAQQEEISQDAMLRVWQAYKDLDVSKGWKSFMQFHCRGACLDYIKAGRSDIEAELTANDPKDKSKLERETVVYKYKHTTVNADGLRSKEVKISRDQIKAVQTNQRIKAKRVEIIGNDEDSGEILSIDDTCALLGITENGFELNQNLFSPNWELLGRLVADDENLHIIAKILLGFSQEQIAEQFGTSLGSTISRERISQRLYETFSKFDSIENLNSITVKQSIYALGLCKYYHEPEIDQGIGWDKECFDLSHPDSFKQVRKCYSPTFQDLYPDAFSEPIQELAI